MPHSKAAAGKVDMNVLLVDDRPDALSLLRHMLRGLGLHLHTANSGAEALAAGRQIDLALILLDVSMPVMDGFETAEALRKSGCKTPIIFVTATLPDEAQQHRGYAAGAVDYLYKPLHADVVRAKVSVFVQLYRQREQIRRQAERLKEHARKERELLMVRAEAALSAREAEYDATARQAPFGVGIVAPDGRWSRINPCLCAMVGHGAHDLPPLAQLIHADHQAFDGHALQQLLHGHAESYRSETRLQHRQGRTVWVSMALSRLGDARHSSVAAVMEDITERKWQEKCQHFLNQVSRTLLSSLYYHDTVPAAAALAVPWFADWCAIDVVSPDGLQVHELVVVHRDPALLEDVHHLRRGLWWDHEHNRVRLPTQGPIMITRSNATWLARTRDPDVPLPPRVPASWLNVPMMGRGRLLGAVTFASDPSLRSYQPADLLTAEDFANRCAFAVENARLYAETQGAVRARDEFLSVAAHELRTPLTPLRLQLQRLIGTRLRAPVQVSPERMRDILQRSERHVVRLTQLIDNLLDVSRITSGRLHLDLVSVDLAELLRDVVGRFGEELSMRSVALTLDINTDAPVVGQWDRLRLEQVVINLLTNAIKYGQGKPIHISLDLHDEVAELRVRDHGIGIAPDKIEQIFERFERAVPMRAFGGLGLGLFIARQILRAHGGTIAVHSKLEEGTEFTVILPLSCVRIAPYFENATNSAAP